MTGCVGTDTDHCCWLGDAGSCSFLREYADGRRWSCALRAEHGSWSGVHADPRYRATVRPLLTSIGVAVDCGDWPSPGTRCATCGLEGG